MPSGNYTFSVSVIGAKELEQALASVDTFAKKAIQDAINKTGYEVQRRAVKYAPHLHGPLRDSIHLDKQPGHLAQVSGNNIQAVVGTNVKYAHYQEMGGYGKRKVKKYTEPGTGKLYMKRAMDESKPVYTNNMQEALKKIVDHLAV